MSQRAGGTGGRGGGRGGFGKPKRQEVAEYQEGEIQYDYEEGIARKTPRARPISTCFNVCINLPSVLTNAPFAKQPVKGRYISFEITPDEMYPRMVLKIHADGETNSMTGKTKKLVAEIIFGHWNWKEGHAIIIDNKEKQQRLNQGLWDRKTHHDLCHRIESGADITEFQIQCDLDKIHVSYLSSEFARSKDPFFQEVYEWLLANEFLVFYAVTSVGPEKFEELANKLTSFRAANAFPFEQMYSEQKHARAARIQIGQQPEQYPEYEHKITRLNSIPHLNFLNAVNGAGEHIEHRFCMNKKKAMQEFTWKMHAIDLPNTNGIKLGIMPAQLNTRHRCRLEPGDMFTFVPVGDEFTEDLDLRHHVAPDDIVPGKPGPLEQPSPDHASPNEPPVANPAVAQAIAHVAVDRDDDDDEDIDGAKRRAELETKWQGHVIETHSAAHIDDLCFVITQPYRRATKTFEPYFGKALPHTTTRDDFVEHMHAEPPAEVAVQVIFAEQSYKRMLNGAKQLYDPETAHYQYNQDMKATLLAMDIDKLNKYDPCATIESTLQQHPHPQFASLDEFLDLAQFDKSQRGAVHHTRESPGRISLIQGPPGTGKSHLANWLALLSAAVPQRRNISDGNFIHVPFQSKNFPGLKSEEWSRHQFAYVAHANSAVQDGARRIANLFEKNKDIIGYTPMVVHETPLNGVISLILNLGNERFEEDGRPAKFTAEQQVLLSDDEVAKEGEQLAREAFQTSIPGVSDQRIVDLDLSTGTRMKELAGIINSVHTDPDRQKYERVRELYWQHHNSDVAFNEGTMTEYKSLLKNLRAAVLKRADVVCMTVSQAGASNTFRNLHVDIMILDEAAKVRELELATLNFYRCAIIFIGDPAQLATVLMSEYENLMKPYLERSTFVRLQDAGYPYYMLIYQRRSPGDSAQILSCLRYGGKLLTHLPSLKSRDPQMKLAGNIHDTLYGVKKTHAVIECPWSREGVAKSGSRFNTTQRVAVLAAIKAFKENGFPTERMVVISPYRAQRGVYRATLSDLHKRSPSFGWNNVKVATIDYFQGREEHHIFLDFTATKNVGFMDRNGRLTVAISRCQISQTTFVNSASYNENRGFDGTLASQYLWFAHKYRYWGKIPQQIAFESLLDLAENEALPNQSDKQIIAGLHVEPGDKPEDQPMTGTEIPSPDWNTDTTGKVDNPAPLGDWDTGALQTNTSGWNDPVDNGGDNKANAGDDSTNTGMENVTAMDVDVASGNTTTSDGQVWVNQNQDTQPPRIDQQGLHYDKQGILRNRFGHVIQDPATINEYTQRLVRAKMEKYKR